MYAVIRTGGKQLRVAENDRITVERLPGAPGDQVALADVLMLAEPGQPPLIGARIPEGAKVFAELVAQQRGPKILVFKKKRRKNHRRLNGHRQEQTVLRITAISPSGEAPAAAVAEVAAPAAAAALASESEE
jgi:large subunit ribosomal protein L21